MSMIYFNDGGVYDPGTNAAVFSVYVIDPEMLLPWKKIKLPLTSMIAPAVSFDGIFYAACYDSYSSTMTIVNAATEEIINTQYNAGGDQTKGAGFALNGSLHIGSLLSTATFAPPYTTAVESAFPGGIQAFSAFPNGARAIVLDSGSQAYIFDLTTSVLGAPIPLLVDGAESILSSSLRMSPDGSKFLVGSVYGAAQAFAVYDAVTGFYLGRTGAAIDLVAMFMADSKRIVYRGSDYNTLQVFDLAAQSATTISLGVLDNDPPFSYGGDFILAGMTEDDYAVMNNYGSIRLLSTVDGSVRATPRPNIKANGFAIVQPLPAGAAPEVLTYFWSGFEKAYENPVLS